MHVKLVCQKKGGLKTFLKKIEMLLVLCSLKSDIKGVNIDMTKADPIINEEISDNIDYIKRSKVIYHDDDKTTFEFVMATLIRFFGHDPKQALELTYEVHEKGESIVAVLPRETAEFKRDAVVSVARAQKFPFCVTLEDE